MRTRIDILFILVCMAFTTTSMSSLFGQDALTVPQQKPGTTQNAQPPANLSSPEVLVRDRQKNAIGVAPDFYGTDGLTPDEAINVAVYENCNRSVVNISTLGLRSDRFFMRSTEEGNGSGAVIDAKGHILTNFHVIERAQHVNVTLYNEETYPATLVGADPVNDIAVIKIEAPAEELFPVSMGDSSTLRVGMRVFALGNPFGLERTMSQGMISSLNRTLEVQRNWIIKSIIQIDAAINPGNSGGPLIDTHGRLVGMNTAIASRVEQSAGIGFAIPVNLIRRVVPELIKHGRVIRGEIGITHVTVTDQGLRVSRLTEGGPAEKAGVRGPAVSRRGPVILVDRSAADVIIAVNQQPVATAAEFLGLIESKKPGDVVTLTILRNKSIHEIAVTLGGDVRNTDGFGI
ncbi:trypsin-like peptidase domain-containing protein [Thalassoglobus sp. JC818]|uniref:S1C family serine protease n=1 Tax=Thalassoglobus sp. JC818 TaxID=3232136 RepID=UPI003458E221